MAGAAEEKVLASQLRDCVTGHQGSCQSVLDEQREGKKETEDAIHHCLSPNVVTSAN